MCRLIETICLENGEILRASYHNARMNAARKELFGITESMDVERIINQSFADRTRCRITYGREVESVEYFPYRLRQVRTLNLVRAEADMDYHLKYADRACLDGLFAQRGSADDVLVVKDGRITDTSIGNVALFDGNEWHTPVRPLLRGTHRQYLLDAGLLVERDIKVAELSNYVSIRVFNAMIHWGEVEIPLSAVGLACKG